MKNYFFFIPAILFLLLFFNACKQKQEGVNLKFNKKEKLKPSAEIVVNSYMDRYQCLSVFNISKSDNFHYRKIYSILGLGQSFIVNSDGASIFIENKKTITQINTAYGSIIKKINIKEAFPNKTGKCEFDKLIAVSEKKIWFTITKSIHFNEIFYWEYKKNDYICKKTKFKFHTDNIVLTSQSKYHTDWFYLKNNEPIKMPVKPYKSFDFNFVDHSQEKGWLFSANHPDPNYDLIKFITYINPKNDVVELCKGGLAVFGNDDFVYFVREQATLWRISLKSRKEELVFTPSKLFSPKDKRKIDFFPPIFNHDKTLMMFPYEQKNQGRYSSSSSLMASAAIVVFDFINKEYLVLDRQLNPTPLRYQNPQWINKRPVPIKTEAR